MLKQALQYLERGWSIVPCSPNTKVARIKWAQYQERLPEKTSVETWFANEKNNIALITGKLSGIVVVDIDPRHGGKLDGHDNTLTVSTPSGGWHLYYQHPGFDIPNSAGLHGPGVDVRGDGGYVVMPPSVINGIWYKPTINCDIRPLPQRFLKPPPQPEATTQRQINNRTPVLELVTNGVVEGGRNNAIAKIAGHYARKDMSIDIALLSIQALNRSGETIKPPLDSAEVEVTVRSVYAGHKRRNKVEEYREIQLEGKTTGDFDVVPYAQYMADNAPSEAQWLLPGWLLRETIALLVAPPESYKTWLEFDMAVAIAGRLPFLNNVMPDVTGPVLIIQQEDHPGQNVERISTIQHIREDIPKPKFYDDGTIEIVFPTDLPILFHPDAKLRFGNPKCMVALDRMLDQYRPALVVIDPLYSAIKKTDDYMAGAVQDMMILKQWREAYNTSFLIGHHTAKSANKTRGRDRMWGSQLLNGFLEQHIHLWKLEGVPEVIVRHGSKREGPEPTVHVKLGISTKDPDLQYNIQCDEIAEERAEELINPPESVTKVTRSPRLSEIAKSLLESIDRHGPLDILVWSRDLGLPLVDAERAARELKNKNRAVFSAGKWGPLQQMVLP